MKRSLWIVPVILALKATAPHAPWLTDAEAG